MGRQSPQIKVQLDLPNERVKFKDKLAGYWQLLHADKPMGILLLLWPALWALWIAGEGNPDWNIMLVFVLGTILMRSAGCAMVDFADRLLDKKVVRHHQRPIARGVIKPQEALAVFVIFSLLTFLLVLTLNLATILLFTGAVVLAALYPFMKRYTQLSQFFLGLAFGWSVLMAFMAVQNSLSPIAWLIYTATLLWVVVFATQHAMVSREEDIKMGIRSTAILFGKMDVYIIGLLQLAVILLLLWAGDLADRSWFYFLTIALSLLFFIRQQQLMLKDDKAGAFAAYLNSNCFGMTVFLILLVDYLITA